MENFILWSTIAHLFILFLLAVFDMFNFRNTTIVLILKLLISFIHGIITIKAVKR